MSVATDDLRVEHEGILRGLAILGGMADRLEAGEGLPAADAGAMVEFLRLFADKCHHGKEEGILFPAMERRGVRTAGGPIGQMLAEHEAGRAFVAGIAGAVGPGGVDAAAFAANARGYADLLRAHIAKENGVLFPLADAAIPAEELDALGAAFERHEATAMGPGVHERLHALLDSLGARYAPAAAAV